MPNPSYWKEFCQWNKDNHKLIPKHINLADINRFATRYRLASGFKSLQVDGFSEKTETVDGYSAMFKVFLAYTALEQLHKASKEFKKQHLHQRFAKPHPELAQQLREAESILIFLNEHLESKYLKEKLKEFEDEKHDVCLYVATGLRHAFSHGFMSAHAKNTSPKKTIDFCNILSEMLLKLADEEFSKIVQSLHL